MNYPISVKSGLFAGLIACATWLVLAGILGFRNFEVDQYRFYAEMILLVAGIIVSILLTRKQEGKGYIDYKAAVKAGIQATLLFGFTMCIFTFIYYKFINPGFIDYLIAEAEKIWRTQAATEDKIKQSIEAYRSSYTPFRAFMLPVFLGTILSLLFSLFLKKKSPEK